MVKFISFVFKETINLVKRAKRLGFPESQNQLVNLSDNDLFPKFSGSNCISVHKHPF